MLGKSDSGLAKCWVEILPSRWDPSGICFQFAIEIAPSLWGSNRKLQLLSTKVVREVQFRSSGSKIATSKYKSSTRGAVLQLRLENRNV